MLHGAAETACPSALPMRVCLNSKMDSFMKMVAVALLVLSDPARGSEESCTYRAVGESLTIDIQGRKSCNGESALTWKLNSTDIFRKRRDVISLGKSLNVMADGSLRFVELRTLDSGEYKAELFDSDGAQCGHAAVNLCVIERVSRPSVTQECSQDGVTLACSAGKAEISWSRDGHVIGAGVTLTVPGRPDHDAKYSCTAWNKASVARSDDLTIHCAVQLSATVMPRNQGVKEGGAVTILCNSTPPADQYSLWNPRRQSLSAEADGEFRLQKVTKEDEGLYTCQAQWTLPRPYPDTNATVELRFSSGNAGRPAGGGMATQVTSGTTDRPFLLTAYISLFFCLSALIV
ncbi:T-cell surface antigen CD2-like [Conger conger]|uniref:T-cell surface antigen CD2-like n=1 Tax=Conger conger TaxID=82655 RepID=UPI002A5AA465|nr:T-cell surface antigen CD2-like [Conger conger]